MSNRATDATDGTTEEQQLHQNLQLLGLSGTGCRAAPAGVEIGRFTFRKPSSRALEHVLYHLYSIIVGEAVAQKVTYNRQYLKAISFISPCMGRTVKQGLDFCLLWP